jgi:hypothetical protein
MEVLLAMNFKITTKEDKKVTLKILKQCSKWQTLKEKVGEKK